MIVPVRRNTIPEFRRDAVVLRQPKVGLEVAVDVDQNSQWSGRREVVLAAPEASLLRTLHDDNVDRIRTEDEVLRLEPRGRLIPDVGARGAESEFAVDVDPGAGDRRVGR